MKKRLIIGLIAGCWNLSDLVFAKQPDYQKLTKTAAPGGVPLDKLKFLDAENQEFSLDQFRGRLILIDFFFTSCPNICPPQTAGLARTWDQLDTADRRSIVFVSVSLDPKRDTVEALQEYRQRFGIKAATWLFASGKEETVRRLARQLGNVNDDQGPLEHRGRLYLLDTEGHFLRSFPSTPTIDSGKLSKELSRAVQALVRT